MIGRKTEKTRFKRSVKKITDKMREIRHWKVKDQIKKINEILRGHYNYYGICGNFHALIRLYNKVERFWRKMLSSRSWKSYITWDKFNQLKKNFPILQPRLKIPSEKMKSYAML
jgi:hypothetical protein